MEVFGTVASAFAILEVAQKINTLRINVKDAEKEWKRYCESLHAVACIQNVLATLKSPDIPAIRELVFTFERDEAPVSGSLVEHVDAVLSKVMADANELVKRNEQLSSGRMRRYLQGKFRHLRLALAKQVIVSMIESVQHAHQHLHMALTLVTLSTNNSWQSESRSLLDQIKTDMATHARELMEKLERSGEMIKGALDLDVQEDLCRDRDLRKCRHAKEVTSTQKGAIPQNRPSRFTVMKTRTRRPSRKPGRRDQLPVIGLGIKADQQSGHEADSSSEDGDEHHSHGIANALPRDKTHRIPVASGYEIVSQDGKWVQVPVESAASPQHVDGDCPSPPVASTTIRVERLIESLPESRWEDAKDLPVEELTDFLSSAQHTAYATDVETVTSNGPHSPIMIRSDRHSSIHIDKMVNLASCRAGGGSKGPNFCTTRVSVTGNIQLFYVIEPCPEVSLPKCRHVTLKIEDGDALEPNELPIEIQLASWYIGEPSGDEVKDGISQRNDSVASLLGGQVERLALNEHHNYTMFDHDGRIELALPVEIFASIQNYLDGSESGIGSVTPLSEEYVHESEDDLAQGILPIDIYAALQIDSESSGDSTVLPLSEDGANESGDDQYGEQAAGTAGFSSSPTPDEDECALRLLILMILGDSYEPPPEVELDLLIRFILLIDKYRQYVGDDPLIQAEAWASSFIQFANPDTNALAWLWITWKLGMGPEFLKLSSIIQRNARFPVSHWQDGLENEYGLKLPELLIDQLDKRRINVLTRVVGRITSEIEKSRQQYLDAVESESLPWSVGNIMLSSFIFGYLKLESDRFLKLRDPGLDVDVPKFWGLSFVEVKECVSSMQDLSDWKVCSVPIADRMPVPLAMLSAVVPILGVGLHQEGIHIRTLGGFKDEMVRLIEEIERESWGVDLVQIGE